MAAKNASGNGVTAGFEAELSKATKAIRPNLGAAKYKHVVLGLIK